MRALKIHITTIGLCLGILLSQNMHSQNDIETKKIFVRVYDLKGKKFEKGHIQFVNDTFLGLIKGSKTIEVSYLNIGIIKTKRSGGHNVLVGSFVGATVGAISGATLIEPDPPDAFLSFSRGDNAAIGAFVGMFSGAAVGGVIAAIKKSETFIIDGQRQNWQLFRVRFSK